MLFYYFNDHLKQVLKSWGSFYGIGEYYNFEIVHFLRLQTRRVMYILRKRNSVR